MTYNEALNEVPEDERESVDAKEISEGDYIFVPRWTQWITVTKRQYDPQSKDLADGTYDFSAEGTHVGLSARTGEQVTRRKPNT